MKKIVVLVVGGNEHYVRDILRIQGFNAHRITALVVEPTEGGPVELSKANIAELMRTNNVFAVIDGERKKHED